MLLHKDSRRSLRLKCLEIKTFNSMYKKGNFKTVKTKGDNKVSDDFIVKE